MNKLILLRHGQSQWNQKNRFTGWKDVDLSSKGILEAKNSGRIIKEKNIKIDKIYSSNLKRANNTAVIAMKEAEYNHLFDGEKLIMIKNDSLNERDYGELTGLNKLETANKFGKDQVHIWRRSFDINPPGGESLKDVVNRVEPYFNEIIKKDLLENKNILVAAHGNSLRALFFILNFYDIKSISQAEIPTGKPFVIEYEKEKIINKYYL
ncbi:MAG: 2,3-bisphosphoglycerate-dependent phosphoglycerate mutase [Alphaproteobacteria bacterium MarineAlpha5_Bin8]|nr:MAG: 2,3-bisphosphoglycerate-dependent phosphoglycerate mutase [Alphaproteobacteria bacterium MarineAlpha5_Bin7]PPR48246.1 MAG: 2,3-bisphosphoglycerate-dependent phosphoglycerate mutase [Alphaproteobacteria bacterium MarineAlpha5_Bin8]PPR54450.1 MAG: 2,3-bisphosphoglycerate-dependent phosphoglycerate mutase [Alphaproteobacteria bacterium MarineAlpha5_Bin6]|tara:strand:- start:173 stop:799 length:627 start_codon:yes stop_codon:yes gene_type:complete